MEKQNILVFTKIGPVCSGNDRSVSRVINCSLTCVGAETFVSSVMIMSSDENKNLKTDDFQSWDFTPGHRGTEKFVYGVRSTIFLSFS